MTKNVITTDQLEVLAQSKFNNSINIIRHAYVDITGDLIAGALLGQILYWFEPDAQGRAKVRIYKEGYHWLAKDRREWFDEIRITPKQFDRAIRILEKKELVIRKRFKFNGLPKIHIRPLFENINHEINNWLDQTKKEIEKSYEVVESDRFNSETVNPLQMERVHPLQTERAKNEALESPSLLGITQRGKRELPKGENGNQQKGKSINREYKQRIQTENTNHHHQINKVENTHNNGVEKSNPWKDDDDYLLFRNVFLSVGADDIKRHDLHYSAFVAAKKKVGMSKLMSAAKIYIAKHGELSQIVPFLAGGYQQYLINQPKKKLTNANKLHDLPQAVQQAAKEQAVTVEDQEERQNRIAEKLAAWEARKKRRARGLMF